ncbi:hypothetical protein GO003_022665 [Methylicorpusculum oleiharenae]|uniref:hypothetical protein n=1 Tax=Methylicorpusculum oleiharenae TaxID=1338687 RepID=UPI00135AEDF7|nr:hypothetical protein [Methylicorpusculum oleiharenae]MCD2453190.1 hypothetical protein [Methylicorpusculum oleiharenae]
MDGVGFSPPCDLNYGNRGRYDGVEELSTTNATWPCQRCSMCLSNTDMKPFMGLDGSSDAADILAKYPASCPEIRRFFDLTGVIMLTLR